MVGYGVAGCPDTTGCKHYHPGRYASAINVQGTGSHTETAIFDPGIYWMENSLSIQGNACVRPAISGGTYDNGSKGTLFYFNGNTSISLSGSGAGDCAVPAGQTIDAFTTTNSMCVTSGPGTSTIPAGTPSSFSGSVVLGPCNAPTMNCTPNCATNYGDPLGTSDPSGVQRGFVFFQNRATTPSGGNIPRWQGGGAFYLAGNLYFHNSSTYDTLFSFQANGSAGYFNGSIVADLLALGGNAALTMYLNPNTGFVSIKASLLR
jgi:hypothetical protein